MRQILASVLGLVILVLLACDSPGEPYRSRDLKFHPDLYASTATPGTATLVTFNFGAFNTDQENMGPVEWTAVADGSANALASGVFDPLPAQLWLASSFIVTPGIDLLITPTAISHTITVTLDPRGLISDERDRANNSQTLTLVFADANLSFSGAPAVTPAAPTSAQPLTLTATLLNSDTSGALATLNNILVQVQENGTDIPAASAIIPTIAAGQTGTAVIALPAASAGVHTYTVIIDPAKNLVLRDRSLTSTTVSVTVAAVAPG